MPNSELFFNYLSWSNPWLVAIALNTFLLTIATIAPKKLLTPAGQFHGWVLGVLIWGCLGWQGYAVVMFYFLVGSGVTRIGKAQKEAEGIAEKRSGARGPENVWGSALTATLCAVAVLALSILGETGKMLFPCYCWVTRRVFAPNFPIPAPAKSAKLTGSGLF